jgi:hypothetical protein
VVAVARFAEKHGAAVNFFAKLSCLGDKKAEILENEEFFITQNLQVNLFYLLYPLRI